MTKTIEEISERLLKRAKNDRDFAANSQVVVDLLQPQMEAFGARKGYNTYAVRMAVDHRNSAKRDNQYADDIEAAAALIASAPEVAQQRDELLEAAQGLQSLLALIEADMWEECPYPDAMKRRIANLTAAISRATGGAA